MYRKIVISLLLVILLACLVVPLHVLQVKALRDGGVVFIWRVQPGGKLSLGYIHSVEHCRVWDHIKIDLPRKDSFEFRTCAEFCPQWPFGSMTSMRTR